MRKKEWLIVFAFCFLLCACKNEISVSDFLKNVPNDKDYKKEISSGEFKITCVYRPAELICLSELSKGRENYKYNDSVFKKELKKYENTCYMDVRIHQQNGENLMTKGINSQDEYAARLGKITYLFSHDCYLIADEKDTLRALTCIFSNTYGNSPDINVILAFSNKQTKEITKSLDVIYEDKIFGIPEKIVLKYDAREIKKEIPQLK